MRTVAAVFLLMAGLLGVVSMAGDARTVSALDQSQSGLPDPTHADIVYCVADGVALKMDIYAPEHPESTLSPVIMFVHGGGWTSGDKASDEGKPEILDLLSRGYVVASANYRLAPEYIFPSQIEDVKCAVRFLRANSSTYHLDPNRIGVWGASAGGHLASLLGTTDASAGMEGDGGFANESSRVQAVVDMYGRADLASVLDGRPDLLPIFGSVDNLSKYSPITYVTKDDPPFLILHGELDTVVPPQLSRDFYDRLKEAGVPAILIMVKNAGHGFLGVGGVISPTRHEITREVGDFFDSYLKVLDPRDQNIATKTNAIDAEPVSEAQPLPDGGDSMECVQTGKTVRGIFLEYWRHHGGIAQEGYPISSEIGEKSTTDHKEYTVQYFERSVFEYHPENQSPYDVLPSLLGVQLYKSRYPKGASGQRPNGEAGSVFFEKTGHRLGGVFLEYWQQHGGLMQQGYPISDEFTETSAMDGKAYTVQYFERSVFEDHPGNDARNRVLLSQLGTFKYKARYGGR